MQSITLKKLKKIFISPKAMPVLLRLGLVFIISISGIICGNIGMGIIIAFVGFFYEILFLNYTESVKSISIPLETVIPNEFENLKKKLGSPIKIFINNKIAEALEHLFSEVLSDSSEPYFRSDGICSGMVWVIPKANITAYAKLAKYFDSKVCDDEKGYIWSINIIDPLKFDEQSEEKTSISNHIKEANKKAGKMFSFNGEKYPALIRLQLVRSGESESIIPIKDKFSDSLKKSTNAKNFYFAQKFFNENVFIADVNNIEKNELDSALFEESGYFFGDYIIYSDMVVVKWDMDSNILYLMFGKEIVIEYKKIFNIFFEKWKSNNEINITNEILRDVFPE